MLCQPLPQYRLCRLAEVDETEFGIVAKLVQMGLVRLKPGANFGRIEPRGSIGGIGEVDQRRLKADDQHTRLCHYYRRFSNSSALAT